MLLVTNYEFEVENNVLKKDIERLTNQLWKLIPMRENIEDWETQLKTVTNEIIGLNYLFVLHSDYIILITKLLGLQNQDTDFIFFRKTVFETITLLRGLFNQCLN